MFSPVTKSRFQSPPRVEDPEDLRMQALIQAPQGAPSEWVGQISSNDVVLWGYSDDRGVERNGGRTGASEGPDRVRSFFYKMTPGNQLKSVKIWDLGNFQSWAQLLPQAQEQARKLVADLHKCGAFLVSVGGGHDWAYSDFVDFCATYSKSMVLNLDAHLDMRPNPSSPDSCNHSGTPFRRIFDRYKVPADCRIAAVGLQSHCNASHHVKWAESRQARMVWLSELGSDGRTNWQHLQKTLQLESIEHVGLSVDLDAFPQHMAPGVSAPQSLGLEPTQVMNWVEQLAPKIRHLGIYELNPRFDVDDKTARLAAKLIHSTLEQKYRR